MPVLSLTTRYSKQAIADMTDQEALSYQRKYYKKHFGYDGKVDQKILTEGNPDGLGDINPALELVIQTQADLPADLIAEIKAKDDG